MSGAGTKEGSPVSSKSRNTIFERLFTSSANSAEDSSYLFFKVGSHPIERSSSLRSTCTRKETGLRLGLGLGFKLADCIEIDDRNIEQDISAIIRE